MRHELLANMNQCFRSGAKVSWQFERLCQAEMNSGDVLQAVVGVATDLEFLNEPSTGHCSGLR